MLRIFKFFLCFITILFFSDFSLADQQNIDTNNNINTVDGFKNESWKDPEIIFSGLFDENLNLNSYQENYDEKFVNVDIYSNSNNLDFLFMPEPLSSSLFFLGLAAYFLKPLKKSKNFSRNL